MRGSVSILARTGSWPARWKPWLTAALDLIFPPLCPVCRELLGDGRRDPLCGTCWGRLSRIGPPWCRCCGVPLTIDGQCGTCRSRPPRFAYARAAARYGDEVREAIHAFKFAGRRSLADPLGDLLADLGLSALPGPRPDVLVPVPLHRRRQRDRGYNQALLLARRLEQHWQIPVAAGTSSWSTTCSRRGRRWANAPAASPARVLPWSAWSPSPAPSDSFRAVLAGPPRAAL
jgi:predicted amidophosphoribosyltransferase